MILPLYNRRKISRFLMNMGQNRLKNMSGRFSEGNSRALTGNKTTTYRIQAIFFFCGAATQRGSWPTHS
jgi:hypothetical protein